MADTQLKPEDIMWWVVESSIANGTVYGKDPSGVLGFYTPVVAPVDSLYKYWLRSS